MLPSLDRRVELKTVILAFPVAFLIHDSEEILTAERFWRQHRAEVPLPAALKNRIEVTTAQFAVAVAYLFAIIAAISSLAARSLWPGRAMNLFTTLTSVLFVNALTHVGQTLLLRRYTPGVVTAVTVALPYSLYTLRRLRRETLISRQTFSRSLMTGALLLAPAALSAHGLAKWLTRRR